MTFRKRIENFIYYYKWHTIIIIAVIAILAIGIKSSIESKEPDIDMFYVSDSPVAEDTAKKLEKSLSGEKLIVDANGDGEKYFFFDPLVVSYEENSQDYTVAQKLQVKMMTGTQTVMLVHQYILEDYDGSFEDISEFSEDDTKAFTGKENFVTGISVAGNKYLEDMGINTEKLYVSVHRRTDKQIEKGELKNEYDAGIKILKYILSKQ